MYNKTKFRNSSLNVNKSSIGETIETKIFRVVNNKEPITDNAPIVYTERKDGVNPAHDIRTDRFEIAVDAMDYVTKSHLSKREAAQAARNAEKEGKNQTTDGKQSTNDTNSNT